MAQKLGCGDLCKLCIDMMLEHYTALTAAGTWGFPHPRDVVLAWEVTAGDCTLRQFCVSAWTQPEAEEPLQTLKARLPDGFAGEVRKAIGVEVLAIRPKGSLPDGSTVEDLMVR